MTKLTRRDVLKAAAVAALPAWLAACGRKLTAKTKELRIFNWSDYIGKKTLPGFEQETGVHVVQDLFSDEEEMFSKLKTGVEGYDLALVTDYMVPRVRALGLVEAFPDGRPSNLSNLDKRFLDGAWDPGNKYSVPYLWGTTGIAYNKQKVKKPPTSWNELWNPDYAGRIGMLDNARDSIGVALLLQGLPSESTKEEDLRKAEQLLVKQKSVLKHYTNASYIDELVSGELWLSAAWSGDVLQAARENKEVEYVIPEEGSWMWVDNLCLVSKSENRESALKFVEYVLRPEVEEEIVETVRYPTPNAKAKPLLPDTLQKDPRIFPPASVMKRVKFHDVVSDDQSQALNAMWQRVKLS